jgi:hypothetical protein
MDRVLADQKRALVERLQELAAAAALPSPPPDTAQRRRQWYSDASNFLFDGVGPAATAAASGSGGHWWCRHAAVMSGFLGVLERADAPAVKRILDATHAQMRGCAECVRVYRSEAAAERALASSAPAARRRGLAALARQDADRLAPLLEAAAAAATGVPVAGGTGGGGGGGGTLPALFEALAFARPALDDARCASALAACVAAPAAWQQGGPSSSAGLFFGGRPLPVPTAPSSSLSSPPPIFPGLFVLLAHGDPAVRLAATQRVAASRSSGGAAAAAAAPPPPPIRSWIGEMSALAPVLARWVAVLDGGPDEGDEGEEQEQQAAAAAAPGPAVLPPQELPPQPPNGPAPTSSPPC